MPLAFCRWLFRHLAAALFLDKAGRRGADELEKDRENAASRCGRGHLLTRTDAHLL